MKVLQAIIFGSSLLFTGLSMAQAADIPASFQGKWVNIGNPSEREPYCKANSQQLASSGSKKAYVIEISNNQVLHTHLDPHGHLVNIKHDNLRFTTNQENQIRGLTRRAYQDEHLSRVYRNYSFRYDLDHLALTTPTVNGQHFYRCY